jgi:signal transduction histidine kinase
MPITKRGEPEPQMSASIPLRLEPVNLAVLLAMTTEIMERQAVALGIKLAVLVDDDVPDFVRLDRNKMAWVITSLVGSALRHVRTPGGTVEVHARYEIERSAITIDVRDDGAGIPPDRLKRLLNREGWHPGAALALLLVEDIAAAHGGGIEIESRAERSEHFTNIRVTIPVREIADLPTQVGQSDNLT